MRACSGECSLWEKLALRDARPLRGKRTYAYQLAERVARVRSAPSADVATGPIAYIIGHVTCSRFCLLLKQGGAFPSLLESRGMLIYCIRIVEIYPVRTRSDVVIFIDFNG